MNPAITTDIIPTMPLTSLGDNIWLAGLLVVSMASPSKSAAKHMIIIPTTILSIFMNSYFRTMLPYNFLPGLHLGLFLRNIRVR